MAINEKHLSCAVVHNRVNSQKSFNTLTPTTARTAINKSKPLANNRKWDQKNKAAKKAAGKKRNDNSHSSKVTGTGNIVSQTKSFLPLGDSHVRRLNDCHVLAENISAKGQGGLRSN